MTVTVTGTNHRDQKWPGPGLVPVPRRSLVMRVTILLCHVGDHLALSRWWSPCSNTLVTTLLCHVGDHLALSRWWPPCSVMLVTILLCYVSNHLALSLLWPSCSFTHYFCTLWLYYVPHMSCLFSLLKCIDLFTFSSSIGNFRFSKMFNL